MPAPDEEKHDGDEVRNAQSGSGQKYEVVVETEPDVPLNFPVSSHHATNVFGVAGMPSLDQRPVSCFGPCRQQ